MNSRSIGVVLAVLGVLFAVGWLLRLEDVPPEPPIGSTVPLESTTSRDPSARSEEAAPAAPTPPTPPPPAATRATGSLLVRVTFAEDGAIGANVGMWLDLGADGEDRSERTAITDRRGTVRIDDLPSGPVAIELDRCAGTVTQVIAGTVAEISLSIPSGIDVEARVSSEQGVIDRATVELFHFKYLGKPSPVATIDAGGSAILRDVAPGRLVRAQALGYEPSSTARIVGAPGDRQSIELEFEIPVSSLSLKVIDARGNPAVGAMVALQGMKSFQATTSGTSRVVAEDGIVRFERLPKASWSYRVRHAGHAEVAGQVVLASDAGEEILVTMRAAGSVNGTVRDSRGNPVSDVRIRVLRSDDSDSQLVPGRWRTDVNGHYDITGVPTGTAVLEFVETARWLGSARATLHVDESAATKFDAQLDTSHEIRGRLVDSRGMPIDGADVSVFTNWDELDEPTRSGFHPRPRPDSGDVLETDRDGRFRCVRFDGGHYQLAFWLEEIAGEVLERPFVSLITGTVTLGSDLTYVIPDSALPLSSFALRVENVDGTPNSKCLIRIERIDTRETRFVSAKDKAAPGLYLAKSLVAGRYRVTAFRGSMKRVISEAREISFREHWDAGMLQLPSAGVARLQRSNAIRSSSASSVLVVEVRSLSDAANRQLVAVPKLGAKLLLAPDTYEIGIPERADAPIRFVVYQDKTTDVELDR